jgi:hypothetical protein
MQRPRSAFWRPAADEARHRCRSPQPNAEWSTVLPRGRPQAVPSAAAAGQAPGRCWPPAWPWCRCPGWTGSPTSASWWSCCRDQRRLRPQRRADRTPGARPPHRRLQGHQRRRRHAGRARSSRATWCCAAQAGGRAADHAAGGQVRAARRAGGVGGADLFGAALRLRAAHPQCMAVAAPLALPAPAAGRRHPADEVPPAR